MESYCTDYHFALLKLSMRDKQNVVVIVNKKNNKENMKINVHKLFCEYS